VRDNHIVDRLHKVAHHDWEHSHPLDLSDEGLLADLENRLEDAEVLGLDVKDRKPSRSG
jgi:cardiolipin synthase